MAQVRHKLWFKVWQDRLLSDPSFTTLPLAERGALLTIWAYVARSGPSGRIRLDDGWATLDDAVSLLDQPDENAPEILGNLRKKQWIKTGRGGALWVSKWKKNQETPQAERTRKYRKRKRLPASQKRHKPRHGDKNVTGEEEVEVEVDKPPYTPRKSNPVWDAVCAEWGLSPDTKNDRTRIGEFTAGFTAKLKGADPSEIHRRRMAVRAQWKDGTDTPGSVLKHWDEFGGGGKPQSNKPRCPKCGSDPSVTMGLGPDGSSGPATKYKCPKCDDWWTANDIAALPGGK